MLLLFVGCKSQGTNLTDKNPNKTNKISNNIEFRVSDENSKIWLNNSHIEKISLETDDENNKILVFTTTEEGKTILYNATTENIDKPLSVSADKYLISSATVMAPIEDGKFTFNNKFTDYAYLYNYLTGAKDKMAGVTPPHNLISEETAKSRVFERAGINADNVSDLNIELKIDQDFFGWIYCIDFTANNKEYASEVNAYTGTITKFIF